MAGSSLFGSIGSGVVPNQFHGQRRRNRDYCGARGGSVLSPAASSAKAAMMYQLGWSTLPGLRGLSVSEFRAMPTDAPDNERGDRKSTRLNSSHITISYAVFCLKKKKKNAH